jgi:protein-disulfide isomerase
MKDKAVPILVVAIVVASFVVGMLYGKVSVYEKGAVPNNPSAQAENNEVQQPEAPEFAPLSNDEWSDLLSKVEFMKGKEGAKVTMVEFLDYRCGFCGRYFNETYSQIEKDYIDTGKIKYGMIALPFLGPESGKAAEAQLCAADQKGDEGYFTYHNKLFQNAGTIGTELYAKLATEMGLNLATFNKCLDSGKFTDRVNQDLAIAREFGVNGTPAFLINGEIISGAQPFSEFKRVLDAQLN